MTNDTSSSVKLRWEETVIRVVTADVPVDQLPDRLVEYGDGGEWSIATGDVDSREVENFLSELNGHEESAEVESWYIDGAEFIPPIQIAAAPVAAIEARYPEDSYPAIPAERMIEYAEEAVAITGVSECERTGEHQPDADHRWQECPSYHGEGLIE